MLVINARNVNDAYRKGLRLIASLGEENESRNGPVYRVPDIVSTVYAQPNERVLFDDKRDANPFFHLFEALWMLDGNNDVAFFDKILPSFQQFSDDGRIFHGAYGHRWRHWPVTTTTYTKELDQIDQAIKLLEHDHTTRRAVICMWDPMRDLGISSKDIPCNDLINLGIRGGALDMSVMCRSNDVIWGCYGANAVHFSVLHEYLATMIGVSLGTYTQISFDFHAYQREPSCFEKYWPLPFDEDIDWTDDDVEWVNNYELAEDGERNMGALPLVTDPKTFDDELRAMVSAIRKDPGDVMGLDPSTFSNNFFTNIVRPMAFAFALYKRSEKERALEILVERSQHGDLDPDWLVAGIQWLHRRGRGLPKYDSVSHPTQHGSIVA